MTELLTGGVRMSKGFRTRAQRRVAREWRMLTHDEQVQAVADNFVYVFNRADQGLVDATATDMPDEYEPENIANYLT